MNIPFNEYSLTRKEISHDHNVKQPSSSKKPSQASTGTSQHELY